MTWKTFFDLHTMEERHLVAAYAVVLAVQGVYFAWTAWQWKKLSKTRSTDSQR